MTTLAYLECPTGLAGDMCLGALVHAGVPLDYLVEKLALLGISTEYKLWIEQVHRNGQQATKMHVDLLADPTDAVSLNSEDSDEGVDPHTTFDHNTRSSEVTHAHEPTSDRHSHHIHHSSQGDRHSHSSHHASHAHQHSAHTRHLPEIEHLIKSAGLPTKAEAWSLAIFRRLAEAEGAVHGISPDQVHFHEVGATDAIVDIVGTCLGLDWLGIEELYCSPMPTGGGTIRAAHGLLPVPTPAVLKLWQMRQVPIYSNGIERELVTPTGAAIATTLAVEFGPPPPMTLLNVGLGAGSRNLPIPNIVRLWIGKREGKAEASSQKPKSAAKTEGGEQRAEIREQSKHKTELPHTPHSTSPATESITVLTTQIDDLSPQAIGYVFDALFAAGAVDVFTQAIGMKKSRPGILLTVICHPEQAVACEAVLFRETTTLGIRRSTQQRTILQREIQTIHTPYGQVHVKVARQESGGAIVNVQPEYEDCAQLAREHQVPWREVHRTALQTWYSNQTVTASTVAEPNS